MKVSKTKSAPPDHPIYSTGLQVHSPLLSSVLNAKSPTSTDGTSAQAQAPAPLQGKFAEMYAAWEKKLKDEGIDTMRISFAAKLTLLKQLQGKAYWKAFRTILTPDEQRKVYAYANLPLPAELAQPAQKVWDLYKTLEAERDVEQGKPE